MFLRIGEIRSTQGQISDVFKCFANSLSLYNPLASNTDVADDEDDDVKGEREKVASLWQQGAGSRVCSTSIQG